MILLVQFCKIRPCGRDGKDAQPFGSNITHMVLLVYTHAKKQPNTDNCKLYNGKEETAAAGVLIICVVLLLLLMDISQSSSG